MDYRGQEHYHLGGHCSGLRGRWGPLFCHHQQGGMKRSGVNIVLGDGVGRICWWIGCEVCTR